VLIKIAKYKNEKLDDLPEAGLLILNNVLPQAFEDNKANYARERRRLGQEIWTNVMTLFSLDPAQPASAELISFSNLPDHFDEIASVDLYAKIVALAFGVLILFLTFRGNTEPQLIPEHVIKQIAQDSLEKKRRLGIEIPFDARVRVTLVGEGIYEQDFVSRTSGMIRRDVGFEVIRKGYTKKGVIGVHPYSGVILGLRLEKFGYTGKESKDRIIIPAGVINNNNNQNST